MVDRDAAPEVGRPPMQTTTLSAGTLDDQLAARMAQFRPPAGTPGRGFSLPHAQFLTHRGSAGLGGTAADVEIYADQPARVGPPLLGLPAEHPGQSTERVEGDSRRARWFTAD